MGVQRAKFKDKRNWFWGAAAFLVLVMIIQYQNCGKGSGVIVQSSYGTVVLYKNGVPSSSFVCPLDTIVTQVKGIGPDGGGCVSVYGVQGQPDYTCSTTFVPLSTAAGWTYDPTSDTWTSTVYLAGSFYKPGSYADNMRRSDPSAPVATASFTITRNDGKSAANCNP